jgi:hypothetical protein
LSPKKWGALGFKNIDKFGRVLRLKWLWRNWDVLDRKWKDLFQSNDNIDKDLFFNSTYVQIGGGKATPFGKPGGFMGLHLVNWLQACFR